MRDARDASATICIDTASLTDKQRYSILCEIREWYMLRSICTVCGRLFNVSIVQRADNRIYLRFDAAKSVLPYGDDEAKANGPGSAEEFRENVLNVIRTTFIGEWVHVKDEMVKAVEYTQKAGKTAVIAAA